MGDLARDLMVTVGYLSDVERGNRPPLVRDKIIVAARSLNIDPKPLLKAAAETKGTFELDAKNVTSKGREVGAALTSAWSDLTDEELDAIQTVLTRKRGNDETYGD